MLCKTREIPTAEPYIWFPCISPSFLVPIALVCVQINLALHSIQNSELFLLFTQFVLVNFLIPCETVRFLGTRNMLYFSFVLFTALYSGGQMVDTE